MANAWLIFKCSDYDKLRSVLSVHREIKIFRAVGDCVKSWHANIPGNAFAIDQCDNEYGGPLAFDSIAGKFDRLRSKGFIEATRQLRVKYPNWSEEKITRSARNATTNSSFSAIRARVAVSAQRLCDLISNIVVAFGHVRMVVEDESGVDSNMSNISDKVVLNRGELTPEMILSLLPNQVVLITDLP